METTREAVLRLRAQGNSYTQIATALRISRNAVSGHLHRAPEYAGDPELTGPRSFPLKKSLPKDTPSVMGDYGVTRSRRNPAAVEDVLHEIEVHGSIPTQGW